MTGEVSADLSRYLQEHGLGTLLENPDSTTKYLLRFECKLF
jgi:hypothetical protein